MTGVSSTSFRGSRVARHTDDAFVVAPSWGAYLFGLFLVCFGGSFTLLCSAALVKWVANGFPGPTRRDPGGIIVLFVAFSLLVVWLGLRGIVRSTRFDKATGRMTQRRLWRTRHHALPDVVAVQCLYAGLQVAGGPRGSTSWHEYQLNVLVGTGAGERVNVCGEPNGPWVRATAKALAEFLNRPFVDHFAYTEAPCDQIKPGLMRRLRSWFGG